MMSYHEYEYAYEFDVYSSNVWLLALFYQDHSVDATLRKYTHIDVDRLHLNTMDHHVHRIHQIDTDLNQLNEYVLELVDPLYEKKKLIILGKL